MKPYTRMAGQSLKTFEARSSSRWIMVENYQENTLEEHSSLRNRVMFVSVAESDPAAAFLKLNNPNGDFDQIKRAVKQGFLVRTRADSGTKESRINDTSNRDKAFASGAQFVSTDYPEPDARFSNYRCRLPDGLVARLNPISASTLYNETNSALEFDLADVDE